MNAHILNGSVVLPFTSNLTTTTNPNPNTYFHNERIIAFEQERRARDLLLVLEAKRVKSLITIPEFHYYIERPLAKPYNSLEPLKIPSLKDLTKPLLFALLLTVFKKDAPKSTKKTDLLLMITDNLDNITIPQWYSLAAFLSLLPGMVDPLTTPPIPLDSKRYKELYSKSSYLDRNFFPHILLEDEEVIADRIENLLYPTDTDPFLNWNSPRLYLSTIGPSLILTNIYPNETISHPLPIDSSALDLSRLSIEPVLFVLSQKTGQYRIHRTMCLSWSFEYYIDDCGSSGGGSGGVLIGERCFGKFASFTEEEVLFLRSNNGSGGSLYLQISNQHLLSRLGGGDDIVVLQCFIIDPLSRGSMVIGCTGGGGLRNRLPLLGKDEILQNLKSSIIAQITIRNRCPFSLGKMDIPVRSRHCQHLQSFDFVSALKIAYPDSHISEDFSYSSTEVIRCPVCDAKLSLGDLFRDGLMSYILENYHGSCCVEYEIDIETLAITEKKSPLSSSRSSSTVGFEDDANHPARKAAAAAAPPSHHVIDLTLTADEVVEEGFEFERTIKKDPFVGVIPEDHFMDDSIMDDVIMMHDGAATSVAAPDDDIHHHLLLLQRHRSTQEESGDSVFDAIVLE